MRALAIIMMMISANLFAAEGLNLNVYGLSWHPSPPLTCVANTDQAKQTQPVSTKFSHAPPQPITTSVSCSSDKRGVNPGLGINYTSANGSFVEAGAFIDSASNTAFVSSVGKTWAVSRTNVRLGGALTLFSSETYNDGRVFVAPVPTAIFTFNAADLHVVMFPRVGGVNNSTAIGFYLSVPIRN